MDFKIRTKINSSFGIGIIIFVIIESITYYNMKSLAESNKWVTHTYQVIMDIDQTLSLLKDAETGQRGYVITGEDKYKDPYLAARIELDKNIDHLANLTSDNSDQQERIRKLRPLVAGKLSELAETIELRKSQGFDSALAVIKTDRGKIVMDDIRTILDSMKRDEESLLKKRGLENESTLNSGIWIIFVGTILATFISSLFGFFVSKNILGNIEQILNSVLALSKGDLSKKVHIQGNDEIALMGKAYNESIDSLNEYVEEISRVLSAMSAGDLSVEVKKNFSGDFAEIKEALILITDSFNDLIGEIIDASEQIHISSRQVADSSQSLSQGSNEQASSVEEITSTLAVIELKAKDNAKNAKNASNQALSLKDQAVASNTEMKGMLKAMEEISETSENIAKIIKEIDAIAFQTNILALNAAVEAARAGQHGKGFNVVAEEVRSLASRSANAAKETTKMIEGSIKTVRSGMDIAERTAAELNKMTSGVVDVTELIKDIAQASIEQSSSVVETTVGINQISQVTMSAAATAEESSAASLELSSQAEAFQTMVKRFSIRKSKEEKKKDFTSTKRRIDLK
ncbi:MAG: CHASE3 domain-containing protein [Leptospiraceae bacterium]|nr:CHASE3 domain-containing protein [Leptospiraceae bacterium]